jgi:hypothetical protein
MESRDDIIKTLSCIAEPKLREQANFNYVLAQTEKVNVQVKAAGYN